MFIPSKSWSLHIYKVVKRNLYRSFIKINLKKTKLILISTSIIGVSLCLFYYTCLPKATTHRQIVNVSTDQEVYKFEIKNYQEAVHNIQIKIDYDINGDAQIVTGEAYNRFFKNPILINGKNTYKINQDWYSDSCYIKYIPIAATDGKLTIEIRFATLN